LTVDRLHIGERRKVSRMPDSPTIEPYWPDLWHAWDGGPVEISGTVSGGDDVAGCRVVHAPGHAPSLIVLWAEEDRLAS
jgi:glyoxylase-like metal-dependent hydrolase (beta-lactamase superfamily II)